MNNKSTLSVLLGVLAMGLAKKNSSGSSIRLVRGFQPIVDYKFRIAVDTNIDFSEYLEESGDNWVWGYFPDELKAVLWEYFHEFSNVIDNLDTAKYGFEDFSFFLPDTVETFFYTDNRIIFNFWFIFDKPIAASSEEEFESIFDPYLTDDDLDLMNDFIENKLMTFDPNTDSSLEIFDLLYIDFIEYEWSETYPCVIDVDTGKRYKKPKYKKSNLRKR